MALENASLSTVSKTFGTPNPTDMDVAREAAQGAPVFLKIAAEFQNHILIPVNPNKLTIQVSSIGHIGDSVISCYFILMQRPNSYPKPNS